MTEENNKIPNSSNEKPKKLHLGEDFEMWLKMDKRRNSVEVHKELTDLKEKILEKNLWAKERIQTIPAKNVDTPFSWNKWNKTSDFSALSSNYFDTREKSDVWKGVFSAVSDLAVVFWWVILDLWKDALQLAAHPISTTQESIVLYKKQDPNTKAV